MSDHNIESTQPEDAERLETSGDVRPKKNGHGGARPGSGRKPKMIPAASAVPARFETEPVDVDGEARVDSRVLARDWFGGENDRAHESLMKLVRTHEADLESFGVLRLEVGKPTAAGGRPDQWHQLNEGQTLFLLTLSRPTPRTIALRKELVKRFLDYRDRLRDAARTLDNAAATMHVAAMDYSRFAAMITEGLMPVVAPLVESNRRVESKVNDLDAKVYNLTEDMRFVKTELSRIPTKRCDFTEPVKRRLRASLFVGFKPPVNRLCLICEDTPILGTHGEELATLQYDHWDDDRRNNTIENGMPICHICNRSFNGERGREMRLRKRPVFEMFHMKRKEVERPGGDPPATPQRLFSC